MEKINGRKLITAGKITALLFYIVCTKMCLAEEKEYAINSPDGKIAVSFQMSDDGQAMYDIRYDGAVVMQKSRLGIIREDEDFFEGLRLESVSDVEPVKIDYEMAIGKRHSFSYEGNKRVFHLKKSSGKEMDIIFQVSNDGVAFRYYFPGQSDDIKKITREFSSFNFIPGTKAWIQPMAEAKSGWNQVNPSYEEYYEQGVDAKKLLPSKAGWVFPALFNRGKHWMLISETAPDRNYCGCRLRYFWGNELFVGFADEREVFPGGPAMPESKLPWYTPWRIIVIGDNLGTIVNSTLGTDLAEPTKLKDTSYIKPGKASWSWALLKDGATVYDVQKQFVDYASDMKWEYCLVDARWDKQIGYDKIKKLAKYAKGKNVGLFLWYNSAGDWNTTEMSPKSMLLTHEARVKEFGKIKEMGIKGIKVDFFGGDGQSMMAYYQDIFEDAAEFGLMVNCHGATLPRGWQRTYPNLMSMESVRGFEYVTFEQANANLEANHCCMLPFTRNVFDPMDFTPVCFSEVPNIRRTTTNGFELALSVLFWSGLQHYAEIPEGMAKVADYVKDFLKELPPSWDESRFVNGYPGKFVVIARRSADNWYIGGINGENVDKDLNLKLDFLGGAKKGVLITDGADNRSFDKQKIEYAPGEPMVIKLKGNGGFVIKFDK